MADNESNDKKEPSKSHKNRTKNNGTNRSSLYS